MLIIENELIKNVGNYKESLIELRNEIFKKAKKREIAYAKYMLAKYLAHLAIINDKEIIKEGKTYYNFKPFAYKDIWLLIANIEYQTHKKFNENKFFQEYINTFSSDDDLDINFIKEKAKKIKKIWKKAKQQSPFS